MNPELLLPSKMVSLKVSGVGGGDSVSDRSLRPRARRRVLEIEPDAAEEELEPEPDLGGSGSSWVEGGGEGFLPNMEVVVG